MSMKWVSNKQMNLGQPLSDYFFSSLITEGNSSSSVMFMNVLEENKQGEWFSKYKCLGYIVFSIKCVIRRMKSKTDKPCTSPGESKWNRLSKWRKMTILI